MKSIILKKLILLNFKGIKSLTLEFGQETEIRGANRAGKTTIADAWSWLLFNKDSTDRTAFEIKTLDKNNNVIPKIDHEVEAFIEVDGEEMSLKKTYREKWVKKRGALDSEFAGNETLYHWNDVPMTQRDYQAKINQIVEENVFKLITSPAAFNSLNWQDQRKVLIDISGGVTDEDVARGNPDFEKLLTKLSRITFKEYQDQIKNSIKKAKDEIKMIPTRIDEVERSKPEAVDFTAVEKELAAKQKELASVEDQISDRMKAQQDVLNKRQEVQKEIYSLKSEIQEIEFEARKVARAEHQKLSMAAGRIEEQISEKKAEIEKSERALSSLKRASEEDQEYIQSLTTKNEQIRKEWNDRNAETFHMDEEECKCPTCGLYPSRNSDYDPSQKETERKRMEENFQKHKIQDLNELSTKGKRNKQLIEEAQQRLTESQERIAKGEQHLASLRDNLAALETDLQSEKENTSVKSEADIAFDLLDQNTDLRAKKEKIEELEEGLQNEQEVNTDDLRAQKSILSQEITALRQKLQAKDQIAQANNRIADLENEESRLAQQIAYYERDQHVMEEFTKAKMNRVEELVNDRFSFVKFKLFELQVNGAEAPTCKALVNGVPYSDVNTEGKVNCGLDVLSVLSKHYGVQCPIFLDNRESVTHILPTEAQIINLIVDPSKKKLEVKVSEPQKEVA